MRRVSLSLVRLFVEIKRAVRPLGNAHGSRESSRPLSPSPLFPVRRQTMPLFGTLGRRKRPTVTPEVEWNLKTVDLGGLHASRSMVELATELGVRYEPAEVEDRKTPPTSPGKARVNGQYDSHKCAPLFHSSRQLASSLTWAKPSSMHQSPLVTRSEDGHSVYSRRSTMDPRHSTVSSPGVTSPRKRIRQSTQTFNILVVGPRNVGKTRCVRRFVLSRLQ